MLKKIDHIGVVVPDVDGALGPFVDGLQMTVAHSEVLEPAGVKVAFLPVGGVDVELLQPLSDTHITAQFLKNTGGGVHHICFEVDDIDAAVAYLKDKNYQLIDQQPRSGSRGSRIAFLRPEQFGGLLIELCQLAQA